MSKSNKQTKQNNNNKQNKKGRGESKSGGAVHKAISFADSSVFHNTEPVRRSTSTGTRIRHCEQVDTVANAVVTNWSLTRRGGLSDGLYTINPGISIADGGLFAWLCTQAVAYQSYTIHSLAVQYCPSVDVTVGGNVMMAPNYSVNDPPPEDEVGMMQLVDSCSTQVYGGAMIHLPHSKLHGETKRKYVRTSMVADDLKSYDCGYLAVACVGCAKAVGSALGRLYVHYDIEFFDTQPIPTAMVMRGLAGRFGATAVVAPGGASPYFPLTEKSNTINALFSATTFVLPRGVYQWWCSPTASYQTDLVNNNVVLVGSALTNTITGGTTYLGDYYGGTSQYFAGPTFVIQTRTMNPQFTGLVLVNAGDVWAWPLTNYATSTIAITGVAGGNFWLYPVG